MSTRAKKPGPVAQAFGGKYGDYANRYGQGGCETCGYGADELIGDYDFEKLLADIDVWVAENFGSKR